MSKPNWGYKVHTDNQIDFDKNNRGMMLQILNIEPTFGNCISCGSCAGTCSAGSFTNFSLQRLNIQILRGETAKVASEVEKCMLCGKCTLVCPRGINTRNVIIAIKRVIQN